jgi:hypothetical protein
VVEMMKRTLSSIGAQRAAQAKLVEDLEAPRRRLAEMEALEQELLANKQVLEDRKAALENDLLTVTDFLSFWEPRETKLKDTGDTLTELENAGVMQWSGYMPFNKYEVNRMAIGVMDLYRAVAFNREKRERLQGEIKLLAREIKTLEG